MSIRYKIGLIIIAFALIIICFTFTLIRTYIINNIFYKNFQSTMKIGIEVSKLIPEFIDIQKLKDLANNWEEYKKIVDKINQLAKIFGFQYIYVLEPKDENFLFIISNDFESDIFEEDFLSIYEKPPEELKLAYKTKKNQFTKKPYTDEYGTFVSYFEPLLDKDGNVYAIIGVDYNVSFFRKTIASMYWILLFIIIFIFVMVLILIWYVDVKVTRPLKKISNHAKLIAKGNLIKYESQKLNKGKDEISELEYNTNVMVNNLILIVNELKKICLKLNEISNTNSSLTNEFLESVNSQATSLEEISSAIEEATSSIRVISNNTKDSTEKVIEGSKKAIDASDYIDNIVKMISNVSEYSKRIKKSIELIYEITDETHILALNASIEASKAGDVGRGFSVVAKEIRNLAQKAEINVSEIEKIVKENERIVDESFELISNSKEKLKSIIDLNIQSSNILNEIKDSISEQANVTEELTKALEDINITTQKFLESSEILKDIAKEILNTSDNINKNIGIFKILS